MDSQYTITKIVSVNRYTLSKSDCSISKLMKLCKKYPNQNRTGQVSEVNGKRK